MYNNKIYLAVFGNGRLYPFQHIPREELFQGENVQIFVADSNMSLRDLVRWHQSKETSRDPNFEEIKGRA